MRKGPRGTQPHATGTNDGADDIGPFTTTSTYLLPTDAHVTLKFLRDELHLLARLAEPRSDDDRDEIVVSTEALSDCFSRIAEQIDEVLGDVERVG
jgi:hypothetical protein